jgi:hypothetical protein
VPAGATSADREQRLGYDVAQDSLGPHDPRPSGDAEVEVSVQPAIFMLALAIATTVAAELALVNW